MGTPWAARSLGQMTNGSIFNAKEFHAGFFRLIVGLEDTIDVINDIENASQQNLIEGDDLT